MLGRVADMFIAGVEVLEAEGRVARDRLVDLAGGGVLIMAFASLATLGATAAAVGVTWLLAAAIGVGAALTIVGLGVGVAGTLAAALAWQHLKHGPRERDARQRDSALSHRDDEGGHIDRRETFRRAGGASASPAQPPTPHTAPSHPPTTPAVDPDEPIDEFEIEVELEDDADPDTDRHADDDAEDDADDDDRGDRDAERSPRTAHDRHAHAHTRHSANGAYRRHDR
ncbi:MAG: hypothetical protein R3B68_16680 [Phycisphaerales bacterium]